MKVNVVAVDYKRGHRLPHNTCGAVRRANGDEHKPHSTHAMREPLTGFANFDNACKKCGSRMWGYPGSWDYDASLQQRCTG